MDEYEKIRQRKREEYRKRHRAQVRRKQLINNGIVIGVIILIIATIIIVGALRGKKAKQEEVKAEVTSTLYNPIQPKLDVQLLTPNPYSTEGTREGKRHSCPLYSKSGYVSQTKQRLFQWSGRDQKDQSKLTLCYRIRG